MAGSNRRSFSAKGVGAVVAALCLLLALTSSASAAPRKLWTTGSLGSGAGETFLPRGVAADENLPGHVFVSEQGNNRIDEFDAWGQFIRGWGWGVKDGSAEFQTCTPATGCMEGIEGGGAGQFNRPMGVAVDSEGNVYVMDQQNARVQKFSPNGEFLLMFGNDVNKGPNHPGNICTATHMTEGDECGAGVPGSGPGEFGVSPGVGANIDIDLADRIYVGDKERVEKFASDGTFLEEIAPSSFAGKNFIWSLALDSSGAMYLAFEETFEFTLPDVLKVDPSGSSVCTMEVAEPRAITVSPSDVVYVTDREFTPFVFSHVETFNTNCVNQNDPIVDSEVTQSTGLGTGGACFPSGYDLYLTNADPGKFAGDPVRNFVRAYGPAPEDPACPPPSLAPTISEQFATKVGSQNATLKAQINPHFWKDTSYFLEYGEGECSEGGCDRSAGEPGILLGAGIVDEEVLTAAIPVTGLQPNTEYHYRFVAESEGGGPVYGVDPDGAGPEEATFANGLEGTFKTPPLPEAAADDCPNANVRTGAAKTLEDCRGYEMVSPVDKEDADILVLKQGSGLPARLDQAAAGGSQFTYSSYRAFGDAQAGPYTSQYIASREGAGWNSHAISAVREGPMISPNTGLDSEYKAFSEDLSNGWLVHYTEPILASGGVPGQINLYRRDNVTETYTALSTNAITNTKPSQYQIEFQGFSEDESHAIFIANDNGPPAVKAPETYQLYDSVEGAVTPVCFLPDGARSKLPCSAGSKNSNFTDHSQSVHNAISDDGSVIYFTTGVLGAEQLYVRLNGAETVAVSGLAGPGLAHYWTAAADGSVAIFSIGEELFEFDLASRTVNPIADEVAGVAGYSEDASRIYLVSKEVLGTDPGPTAGKSNLYLHEAGASPAFRYIATVSGLTNEGPSLIAREPRLHGARTTPDGEHLAFMSTAALTGADNKDAATGNPASQVFLFDATTDELFCVSCNRTGARPIVVEIESLEELTDPFFASGQIPGAESQLYESRFISPDGQRLFFQSFDALSQEDTNERRDVYEWEAPGKGTCSTSKASYNAAAGGCVSLITSGKSPQHSQLVDASASGSDVFFTTSGSLVPQDPGLIDIYDAREGGGFPVSTPNGQCEGESCQAQVPPPAASTPGSSLFDGPGNPPVQRKCPKGKKKVKVKGKVKCVRKHKGKKKRAGHARKGASR
jgi:NHL repeat-containing protein